MVGKIIVIVMFAACAMLALSLAWPGVKKLWALTPWAQNSTATKAESAIEKAMDSVDLAGAWTALTAAKVLFRKHGDEDAVSLCKSLIVKALAWDDEPITPDGQG
jgi:hypothetical protein